LTDANNERDEAKKERDALAKLLREIVDAYGSTGKVGPYTAEETALERCIDAARVATLAIIAEDARRAFARDLPVSNYVGITPKDR